MKKGVMIALGALALVGVGAVGAVVTQPDKLHVERSLAVAATPADTYAIVNDFGRWTAWNPWQDLDPDQKTTFSESRVGQGAWMEWAGGEAVGSGRMEITASEPDAKVVEALEFKEPFPSKAVVTFTFVPEGEGTRVTWAMDQEQDFMGKAFGLMVDMDAMLGKDFDKGLGRLKTLAESDATARKEAEAKAAAEAAAAAAAASGAEPQELPAGTTP